MPSPLKLGTAAGITEYLLNQNNGPQRSNRYSITITRKDEEKVFMCETAQLPSRVIRAFSDHTSGVGPPVGIPFRSEIVNSMFTFLIEESWASRHYFEQWQTSVFSNLNNNQSPTARGLRFAYVNYLEDYIGTMKIDALSIDGGINYTYWLYECFPLEMVPIAFEAQTMNAPLKFTVNMYASHYAFQKPR